jgi:hypothetical protein
MMAVRVLRVDCSSLGALAAAGGPREGCQDKSIGLLPQYLPRGTDLSLHTQAKLSAIAR